MDRTPQPATVAEVGVPIGSATFESGTFESAHEVAQVLRPVMSAIAAAVGPHCEVVLHDLDPANRDLAHSIVAIENGHVTGRSVGGPSTNLGLHVVHDEAADHDAFGYRGRTADGRVVNCSSVYYRNRAGQVVAALCINLDLTPLTDLQLQLSALLPGGQGAPTEFFAADGEAVLEELVAAAVAELGSPIRQLDRAGRQAVVDLLDQRGAFNLKKAATRIATQLRVSRVTIYADLDEVRSRRGAS